MLRRRFTAHPTWMKPVGLDHPTVQRWIVKFTPPLVRKGRSENEKRQLVKVGEWIKPIAALSFFRKAIKNNGRPEKVNIDKCEGSLT